MKSKLSKMKPCQTVVFSHVFAHEYNIFVPDFRNLSWKNGSKIPVKRFIICGQSICTDWKIHQISTSPAKKGNSRDSRTVCFENARLAILHFVRGINRARSFERGCNSDLVIRYWASAFLAKTKTGAFYSTWVAFYSAGVFHRIGTCVLKANPTCEIPLKICRQSCE